MVPALSVGMVSMLYFKWLCKELSLPAELNCSTVFVTWKPLLDGWVEDNGSHCMLLVSEGSFVLVRWFGPSSPSYLSPPIW